RRLSAGGRADQGDRRLRRCEPDRCTGCDARGRSNLREWLVQDHYRGSVRLSGCLCSNDPEKRKPLFGTRSCSTDRPWRDVDLTKAHLAVAAAAAVALACLPAALRAQDQAAGALRSYQVIGDAIPRSLTGANGDPARGRSIVTNRQ